MSHGWIAREAADDPAVRAEVLSLLDAPFRAGAFLVEPVADHVPDLLGDDEPLAPGADVGAYTIVRELGRGGMGRVYLATDDASRPDGRAEGAGAAPGARSGTARAAAPRGARGGGLTHPGICTVYALEEIDGELYIATEFVDGHTLREEIRSGAQPAPIATSLRTAPRAGRRRSPARTRRASPTAISSPKTSCAPRRPAEDSRLRARAASKPGSAVARATIATQPGMLVGTPAYMAPEQMNGQPVDARADVFAFGVLLYEYACGVHPFRGVDAAGDGGARARERRPADCRALPRRAEPAWRTSSPAACEGAGRAVRVGRRDCSARSQRTARAHRSHSARDHVVAHASDRHRRPLHRGRGAGVADQGMDGDAGDGLDFSRARRGGDDRRRAARTPGRSPTG